MTSFLLSLLLVYWLGGAAVTVTMMAVDFHVSWPKATIPERVLLVWSFPWAAFGILLCDGPAPALAWAKAAIKAILTGRTQYVD